MNIYDIAKMSGVSTATVSRVINGGPVSRQTRARVNAVLEKTGYQPSPYAQGMNLGSMKLVGILVSQIDDLFYMRAVSILEQRLREMGYDFILYSVGEEMKNIRRYITDVYKRQHHLQQPALFRSHFFFSWSLYRQFHRRASSCIKICRHPQGKRVD